MKRFMLPCLLASAGVALLLPNTAPATDFGLQVHAPGTTRSRAIYWWHFNESMWQLTPPEKYDLTGGGELRLQKTDAPSLAAVCRGTTPTERDLLFKKDDAARAAYFQTQLPGGTTDVKLESQQENSLSFNGLKNFTVVYSYRLGGVKYLASYMVNHVTPLNNAKDKRPDPAAGDYFTALAVAPEDTQPGLFVALEQMLITAQVLPGDKPPEDTGLFVKHGVMN